MESVVTDGSGRHAAVTGYSICGKTGTSEPIYTNLDAGYVASYVAISPVEDTQVVLLLTLYDPPKNNNQGGTVAAPVVAQMLSEILPYLEIGQGNREETALVEAIATPHMLGLRIKEAEKLAKENELELQIEETEELDKENTIIKDQTPKAGISIKKGSKIYEQYTKSFTLSYAQGAHAMSASIAQVKLL